MAEVNQNIFDGTESINPPLVDSMHYEPIEDTFSVIYVPSLSDDPTQTAIVSRDSAEGRQIAAQLYRIQIVIGNGLLGVTHRGGTDYTLQLVNHQFIELDELSISQISEVFYRLRKIASVAEEVFAVAHAA